MIFYEGPSEIGGAPIVGIATFNSLNPKTGPMVQTWILNQHTHPYVAVVAKQDYAVCGDCPLRQKGCYVGVERAPSNVWRKYKQGGYHEFNSVTLLGRTVRLGSYGDPAALPLWSIERLVHTCIGYTGYTHQWRWATHLQPFCMASVESVEDMREATAMGWRCFRIRRPGEKRIHTEAQCPAAQEHTGKKITCHTCLACCGGNRLKGHVSIEVHGHTKKRVFDDG